MVHKGIFKVHSTDTKFIKNYYGMEGVDRNPFYNNKNGLKLSTEVDLHGVWFSLMLCFASEADSKVVQENFKNRILKTVTENVKNNKKFKHYYLADKGYDFKDLRNILDEMGYTVVIPRNKRNIKDESQIIHLTDEEKKIFKKRPIVECSFAWHNNYPVICGLYEKTIESYLGLFLLVSSLMLYIKICKLMEAETQTEEDKKIQENAKLKKKRAAKARIAIKKEEIDSLKLLRKIEKEDPTKLQIVKTPNKEEYTVIVINKNHINLDKLTDQDNTKQGNNNQNTKKQNSNQEQLIEQNNDELNTEYKHKKATKKAAKKAAKPPAKKAAKSPAKKTDKPATKPAVKKTTKPATKKAAKPPAKKTDKPATKPATKPAVKKTTKPTIKKAVKPNVKSAPAKKAAKQAPIKGTKSKSTNKTANQKQNNDVPLNDNIPLNEQNQEQNNDILQHKPNQEQNNDILLNIVIQEQNINILLNIQDWKQNYDILPNVLNQEQNNDIPLNVLNQEQNNDNPPNVQNQEIPNKKIPNKRISQTPLININSKIYGGRVLCETTLSKSKIMSIINNKNNERNQISRFFTISFDEKIASKINSTIYLKHYSPTIVGKLASKSVTDLGASPSAN